MWEATGHHGASIDKVSNVAESIGTVFICQFTSVYL